MLKKKKKKIGLLEEEKKKNEFFFPLQTKAVKGNLITKINFIKRFHSNFISAQNLQEIKLFVICNFQISGNI